MILEVTIEFGPHLSCGRLVHDDTRLKKLQRELAMMEGVTVKMEPVGSRNPRFSKAEEQNVVFVKCPNYRKLNRQEDEAELENESKANLAEEEDFEVLYKVDHIREFALDGSGPKYEEAVESVKAMQTLLEFEQPEHHM